MFCCDSGTRMCFVLWQWYLYMVRIVTVVRVHALFVIMLRVHAYFVTVARVYVLYCERGTRTCSVL